MPRNPTEPELPTSPATWLANFRYHLGGDEGKPLSPEALGFRLGVSGATVRRWESGLAAPREADLVRFAEVCRLSPLQHEFLLRLFNRSAPVPSPPPPTFRTEVANVLSIRRPAYVVDELFYLRAWNSYFANHAAGMGMRLIDGANVIELAIQTSVFKDPEAEAARTRSLVRMMWMWTAHLACHSAYAGLVRHLLEFPPFALNWQMVARERVSSPEAPLVMPIARAKPLGSLFTVYAGQVLFPPLYHVFAYESRDETADAFLQTLTGGEGPSVSFASRLHWLE